MLIFPVRTDTPLRTTPSVNYAIILINVFVFALQELAKLGYLPQGTFDLYSLSPGDPRLVTFVTYSFLHSGWLHVASNMVFLYIFGNSISDKLGQIPYLIFYLASAVFAGVGYVVLAQPLANGAYAPVVGASGAVAAMTGAFLVLMPRANITLFYFFIIFGFMETPALLLVGLFFAQDLIFQFWGGDGVAHSAHIAGSLFGFFVTMALLALRLLPRDQFDLLAMISRWNRRRQYRAAVASGWDPYSPVANNGPGMVGRRESSENAGPPDPRHMAVMDLRAQISEAIAHRQIALATEHYRQLRVLDNSQVLSRNAQLDIANHFAEQGDFPQAAEAYELFLQAYPTAPEHAHIQLLTGVIYRRYLGDSAKALPMIEGALPRLTTPRDLELAQAELAILKPALR